MMKKTKLFLGLPLVTLTFVLISCSQNIDSECKSLAQLSQMTKKEEHKTVKAMSDDCFNTLC